MNDYGLNEICYKIIPPKDGKFLTIKIEMPPAEDGGEVTIYSFQINDMGGRNSFSEVDPDYKNNTTRYIDGEHVPVTYSEEHAQMLVEKLKIVAVVAEEAKRKNPDMEISKQIIIAKPSWATHGSPAAVIEHDSLLVKHPELIEKNLNDKILTLTDEFLKHQSVNQIAATVMHELGHVEDKSIEARFREEGKLVRLAVNKEHVDSVYDEIFPDNKKNLGYFNDALRMPARQDRTSKDKEVNKFNYIVGQLKDVNDRLEVFIAKIEDLNMLDFDSHHEFAEAIKEKYGEEAAIEMNNLLYEFNDLASKVPRNIHGALQGSKGRYIVPKNLAEEEMQEIIDINISLIEKIEVLQSEEFKSTFDSIRFYDECSADLKSGEYIYGDVKYFEENSSPEGAEHPSSEDRYKYFKAEAEERTEDLEEKLTEFNPSQTGPLVLSQAQYNELVEIGGDLVRINNGDGVANDQLFLYDPATGTLTPRAVQFVNDSVEDKRTIF